MTIKSVKDRVTAYLESRRIKISHIAIGRTAKYVLDWSFDNLLYLWLLYRYGVFCGGAIATTLSVLICLLLVLRYERMGMDWLGVNVIEAIKEDGEQLTKKLSSIHWFVRLTSWFPVQIFRIVLWCLKKNDWAAFFALSIHTDPFETTTFLRHGRFDGLKRKDWLVFVGSCLVANGYWTCRSLVVLKSLLGLWHLVS
jgi:hypothetical protein